MGSGPNKSYDVAVIGAGVAGLVSANYLIRNGFSVVLVESYERVGGSCSSFSRENFLFDVGVHYFGSLRKKGGQLTTIFDELDLNNKLPIQRFTPNDVLVTPDFRIRIYNNLDDTIHEFSKQFPAERKQIENFFRWIVNSEFIEIYSQTQNITFRDILDKYFIDEKLKQCLAMPLGNIGLSSKAAAALTAVVLYREYMLDGGYYPVGGVQQFPNILAQEFCNRGGTLLLSTSVKQITINGRKAVGIELENETLIKTKYVISACDARRTYNNLIAEDKVPDLVRTKLSELKPSMSAFIVYLGISKSLKKTVPDHCSHWISPNYHVDKFYDEINNDQFDIGSAHSLATFNSFHDASLAPKESDCMTIFIGAPYKNAAFWNENKESFSEILINFIEKKIGNLGDAIKFKQIATPTTVYKYTGNSGGALYGWAPTVTQIKKSVMPIECPFIDNLYQVGHWATQGYAQGGVPVVALAGRQAAKHIIKREVVRERASTISVK